MNQQDLTIMDRLRDTARELESYIREEYCTDYEDFAENDILKRAVAMCLISIDQLAAGFSDSFITEHQRFTFARFTTLRYIAERSYQSLDFFAVWIAATKELPAFLTELLSAAGLEGYTMRLGKAAPEPRTAANNERLLSNERLPSYETPRPPLPKSAPDWQERASGEPVQKQERTAPRSQEQRPPFAMNELYKRQAYNQMMQMNMTKDEAAVETKKEVSTLLDMLEKEKRSRGL